MSGFADLVPQAQPAIFGGGVEGAGAEGRSWEFNFGDVRDGAGAAIDLSAVTGTCTVYDEAGATLTTLTFTGAVGSFKLSKAKAATVGLAGSAPATGRKCSWGMVLDNGTLSVQVWLPRNSGFTIQQEA